RSKRFIRLKKTTAGSTSRPFLFASSSDRAIFGTIGHDHIHRRDGPQQPVKERLAEPAAIPRALRPPHEEEGDAVFLDEGRDGADDVAPLEGHGYAAELLC